MEVTTEGPIMGQAGGHIIMPKLQRTPGTTSSPCSQCCF